MAEICTHDETEWTRSADGQNATLVCKRCDRAGPHLAIDLLEQGRGIPILIPTPPDAQDKKE